jgi:hypothetical protein
VSLRTLFRSLARSQARDYRGQLSAAAWAHSVRASGTAALVLYDVTTLHFERGDEDELRKVGMSKEHRVGPQVQVGLLVWARARPPGSGGWFTSGSSSASSTTTRPSTP